jgi:hypothetical protein
MTLENWITLTATLPKRLSGAFAVTSGNQIYIMGGDDDTDELQDKVYSAEIKTDGTLENWITLTATLPKKLSGAFAVTSGNQIYIMGGVDGSGGIRETSGQDKVYSAEIIAPSKKLSTGTIVGISVAAVLVAAGITTGIVYAVKYNKKK